jgi:cysteine desulfurase
LNTFAYLESEGWDVSYLPVDNQGLLDLKDLEKAIRKDTVLVSIGHVNSEIGSVQPISRIGQFLKANYPDIIFHSDAVQSFGKIRLRPVDWGIDLLSASGHKVHAPKGIGILYIKKGTPLTTLQWGGGQEMGIRSGTENLTGIVGFGKAAQLIYEFMDREDDTIRKMKMTLAKGISEAVPEAVINGPRPDEGAPHILNISIPGIRGETLLHVLESHGVYISTGSACSSRRTKISHVLEAIGAPIQIAEGAIRLSLSYMSDPEELLLVPDILRKSVDQVKRFTRR